MTPHMPSVLNESAIIARHSSFLSSLLLFHDQSNAFCHDFTVARSCTVWDSPQPEHRVAASGLHFFAEAIVSKPKKRVHKDRSTIPVGPLLCNVRATGNLSLPWKGSRLIIVYPDDSRCTIPHGRNGSRFLPC